MGIRLQRIYIPGDLIHNPELIVQQDQNDEPFLACPGSLRWWIGMHILRKRQKDFRFRSRKYICLAGSTSIVVEAQLQRQTRGQDCILL